MTPIRIDGKIYYAEDLIGLTLFAAKDIPLTRLPFDDSETIRIIQRGNPIGKIHSFVEPTSGRKNTWFQFFDTYNNMYHVEILPGRFSRSSIDQQIQDNKPKPDTVDRIQQTLITGIAAWGLTKVITAFIKK